MVKDEELKGRGRYEGITNLKKGSRMPEAKKSQPTKPFIVAPGVRMGAPDGSGTKKAGDEVQLTKLQAEWCMANGFIDATLPDFEPDPEPADNRKAEGSSRNKTEGS